MYDHVTWPVKYHPKASALYALNDMDVKAPPEIVWKLLVEAENWLHYFPYESQVKLPDGQKELTVGMVYHRTTFSFPLELTVTECEPLRRLSWSTVVLGHEHDATAYHGWVITPTDTGCHVLHEETQQGEYLLEEFGRKRPGGLYAYHQEWSELLTIAAETEAAKQSE